MSAKAPKWMRDAGSHTATLGRAMLAVRQMAPRAWAVEVLRGRWECLSRAKTERAAKRAAVRLARRLAKG